MKKNMEKIDAEMFRSLNRAETSAVVGGDTTLITFKTTFVNPRNPDVGLDVASDSPSS